MSPTAIIFFVAIVGMTLVITWWASRRTSSASDFYTAGGGLTGWQNGLAIAGDYLSAASFLGIAGSIALFGFDGFFFSIGYLVAYLAGEHSGFMTGSVIVIDGGCILPETNMSYMNN